jgi:DNA (cytosine-5)-methyltransferase 1
MSKHTNKLTIAEFKKITENLPDSTVICYNNYDKGFDFIWSSPPCPSHSQIRFNIGFKANRKYRKVDAVYPDMELYQEIIYLKHWFKGRYCVENVITYYEPLIRPQESNNHYFWVNFYFSPFKNTKRCIRSQEHETRKERVDIDLSKFNLETRFEKQVLNNCVEPELGLHILNESKKDIYPELFNTPSFKVAK